MIEPGSVFGFLTVLSHVQGPYYRCRCTCGKETKTRGSRMKAGLTRSCGCLKLTRGILPPLPRVPNIGIRCELCRNTVDVHWHPTQPFPRFCGQLCARRGRPLRDLNQRFWSKVDRDGPIVHSELGPCWIWTASRNPTGYGSFMRDGRCRPGKHAELAHRVAWELERGPIPDGLHALHKCDTPACVNPNHLFLGTNDDNIADRVAKGRSARPSAKLNEVKVAEIRCLLGTMSLRAIAERYGVKYTTIQQIRNRRSWRHVA